MTPRGLCRGEAATYIGVSASLFDKMVADGRMPKPKMVNTRVIWDRIRLDDCFDDLPDQEAANPWDETDEGQAEVSDIVRRPSR